MNFANCFEDGTEIENLRFKRLFIQIQCFLFTNISGTAWSCSRRTSISLCRRSVGPLPRTWGSTTRSAGNGLSRVFRNPVMFVMQHFLISIGPVPGVDLLFAWSVMSAERKIATPIY